MTCLIPLNAWPKGNLRHPDRSHYKGLPVRSGNSSNLMPWMSCASGLMSSKAIYNQYQHRIHVTSRHHAVHHATNCDHVALQSAHSGKSEHPRAAPKAVMSRPTPISIHSSLLQVLQVARHFKWFQLPSTAENKARNTAHMLVSKQSKMSKSQIANQLFFQTGHESESWSRLHHNASRPVFPAKHHPEGCFSSCKHERSQNHPTLRAHGHKTARIVMFHVCQVSSASFVSYFTFCVIDCIKNM